METRRGGRTHHQAESTARQMRVLSVTTRIGAVVSVFFGVQQLLITTDALWLGYLNLVSAVVFLLIPRLYRYGDLLPPVVFYVVAYAVITASTTTSEARAACTSTSSSRQPSPYWCSASTASGWPRSWPCLARVP